MSSSDALTTLLSVDALLVAASTLAATIGYSPRPGARKTNQPANMALAIAGLTLVCSVGGAAAWIQVYLYSGGIGSVWETLEAIAMAVPLAGIPYFAFVSARWAKP